MKSDILHFIELAYQTPSIQWSEYIYYQLKKDESLALIEEICNKSNKKASEAVLILLSALRYLSGNMNITSDLEQSDSYLDYITQTRDALLEIGITRRIQANSPDRALPVLEVLGNRIHSDKAAVIELGASFGLIGYCMTQYERLLKKKSDFFTEKQQFPEIAKVPAGYLGLDIDPPDKKWILSCLVNKTDRHLISNIISDMEKNSGFRPVKSDALHFDRLPMVQHILSEGYTPVILTSFVLYMLTEETRNSLTGLVNRFVTEQKGHWINQCVKLQNTGNSAQFYLQLDGKNIIQLEDDRCRNWTYL